MQHAVGLRRSVVTWLAALLAGTASVTHGATITVTSTGDTLAPNDGAVTLREAVAAINAGNDLGDPDITAATSGTFGTNDAIHFNIPGAGVHTIALNSGLALQASKTVTIDGYSQPGAQPNSLAVGDNANVLIRVDQSTAPESLRFLPGSAGSTLRGVSIVNTSANAVHVLSDNVTIIGNFIGVDTDGSTQLGTGSPVIVDAGAQNTHIGTANPADRNVLDSGNSEMQLSGDFTVVAGNYINTNAAGTAPLGTATHGLTVGAGTALIGGFTPAEGNVIGQWNANGINLGGSSSLISVQIEGNLIGVNALGTARLSPGLNGIALAGGTYTTDIGHGFRNVISGAAQFGIVAAAANGNVTIESNLIGTDVSAARFPSPTVKPACASPRP